MAPPVLVMEAPSPRQKKWLKALVRAALNKNGLPPPPYYYPRPARSTPCVQRIVIRILALEAAMYPDKEKTLKFICSGAWDVRDVFFYDSMVSSAYKKAERLIVGTDAMLQENKALDAKSSRKNYGTKRLFHKNLLRFQLTKELVRKEIEKNPSTMPDKSFAFLGFELVKHHDLVTRFNVAKDGGEQKLRAFLVTEGYAKEDKYREAMKYLTSELDDYYRFHRKAEADTDAALGEARREAMRKRQKIRDKARAQVFIQAERFLEDKGKKLLTRAVTTDDGFLDQYMAITTSGTPTWHADLQTNRERKLVDLMIEYIGKQPENGEEEVEVDAVSA